MTRTVSVLAVVDNTRVDTRARDEHIRHVEKQLEQERRKKELIGQVRDIVNKYYDKEIKQSAPEKEVLAVSAKSWFNKITIKKDCFHHYDFPEELIKGADGKIIKELITISGGNFTDENPRFRQTYLSPYEPSWRERWSESGNIFAQISYSIINDAYVVLQALTNGYFGTVKRTNELTGGGAYANLDGSTNYSPIDNLVGTIATFIPVAPKVGKGAITPLITSEKGFLFGGMKIKLPVDMPVQRFGAIHSAGVDYWGLEIGSSKFIGRVPYAIKSTWNPLQKYSTGVIPKGTLVEIGITGPQYPLYHTGGGIQVIVGSKNVTGIVTIVK
jgi:hypothetical protein